MHDEVKRVARLWKNAKQQEAEGAAREVYRLLEEVVRLLDELKAVTA
jgi:hypothetical protein